METLSDPTDLAAMRTYLEVADPKQGLAALGLRTLVITADAHLSVNDAIASLAPGKSDGSRPRLVILKDGTQILRSGEPLLSLVQTQLSANYDITTSILRDGNKTLHADETILKRATESVEAAAADLVVSIGSGTITDIAKVACAQNGNIPLVVVQTAASVDGFTDNVSVVLKRGVKRTIPSTWPTAVLADTTTVADAPMAMNKAGFGEVMSLFTAPADWMLADLVGLEDNYHPAARDILASVGESPSAWSAGIARRDVKSIDAQTRLLAIRGIVTGMTGTTACLSGAEHVISHMLDMYQAAHGHQIGLHGAQVGVGSVVAGALWQRLLNGSDVLPERLTLPDRSTSEAKVRKAFEHLGDETADECWRDYARKLARIVRQWDRVNDVVRNWAHHAKEIGKLVLPGHVIRDALISAGAPATCTELNPSYRPATVHWAVANCHLMRSRFTGVDLLDLLGLWDEAAVDALTSLIDGSDRKGQSVA